MKSERFDIHKHITNQIVAAIKGGPGEFRPPWHRSAGNIMRPVNIASKRPSRGVNSLTLWVTTDEKGYTSGLFATYKQWAEAGAQVRKGEKAAYIAFYKGITVASDDADSDECETRLFAQATPVFAAERVDCYACPALAPRDHHTPIERAEGFVAKTVTIIHHGGTCAHRPLQARPPSRRVRIYSSCEVILIRELP